MAWAGPASPAAGLGLLLALLGACRPCAAVRLAAGGEGLREEVPPVLAMMPGFRRSPGATVTTLQVADVDGGSGSLPAGAVMLAQRTGELQQSEVVLHELRDPWWVGNNDLQLVTVETRPNKTKAPGINNIGLNREWEGYVTKLQIMTQWLDQHKDDKAHVIFVDGEDTLFGGCKQEQFLQDYREIVDRSGGVKVVIGAERGCYECPKPWHCDTVPKVPEWAYRNWSLADGGATIRASRLDPSGQMRFLNSGFITGPVEQLRPLFRASLNGMRHWEERLRGDQYYVAKHVLDNPKTAVLDYGSSLVTCGYSLNVTKLFELIPGVGMYNRVTEKHQCFFHANGPSLRTSHGIVSWQRGGRKPW